MSPSTVHPPPSAADAPTRDRHGSWRRNAVVIGVIVIVAVIALWAWRRFEGAPPKAAAAPSVPVTTTAVDERDMPVFRTGVGTVSAQQSVTVKVRVDGQLERVDFVEGQDVKAGQLLAQIDPRTFQAQLEQAQAQRARDAAQLANAHADLTRYTNLLAQDAATRQQVDTQKALVAQLEAAVQTDDAAIHLQQVQLGYTRIVAPISGRTGARLVDPGNIVHAADANGIVVINQIDPVAVVFTLPEEAFQDVNRALRASTEPLQVIAFPRTGNTALGSGRLTLLNNQIDTATGTVQLKGSFANAGHVLWPGQYVNVRLVLGHDPHALVVPASAIQRSQEGEFVWLVDGNHKAHNQPVKIRSIQDGVAVIEQGVRANDRVVVDGQYKLREGVVVAEVRPDAAGAPASGASAGASANATRAGGAVDRPIAENDVSRAPGRTVR
ncbi:MAG TPA: efflux RND transporter periplasmic adaptor subunit [Caldimonas sp.]|nr:efflux RND transporter periplasmic adaptor subunit [Caldimonas sp.]